MICIASKILDKIEVFYLLNFFRETTLGKYQLFVFPLPEPSENSLPPFVTI